MQRRRFLRTIGAATAVLTPSWNARTQTLASAPAPPDDRKAWIDALNRIAAPLLPALAEGRLKESMPSETRNPDDRNARRAFTHLEGFGRLMSGIAPWLDLPPDTSGEGKLRAELRTLTIRGLANAVDPSSRDFMNFSSGSQPLVDAAFLALGLLRAPGIWHSLAPQVQQNVIAAFRSTRVIRPYNNNWLLFSAMIEAFFLSIGEAYDRSRIDTAVEKHQQWYKGDGMFGDGPDFHWDYYNSYVIQPFLRMIFHVVGPGDASTAAFQTSFASIAARYAAVQERMIAPDGSFPVVGRSIAYRCGAFHHLANESLLKKLPPALAPNQVRCALSTVIARTVQDPSNYDTHGWLALGLSGHQPSLAESYISTGSLYLAATAFLPLGLPAADPFWDSPPADWTSVNVWSGKDHPADSALKRR